MGPRQDAALKDGNFKASPIFPEDERTRYERQQYRSTDDGRKFVKYYVETKFYTEAYKISSECADILFINSGSNNVTVNDILLTPSQTLRITANEGEIDTTQYYCMFPIPASAGNSLTVVRKLYV